MVALSCKVSLHVNDDKVKDDGAITFKFVQINDVYEIAPLGGGKYGGMARVAHVVDSIKTKEPNTFLFGRRFLNPPYWEPSNTKANGFMENKWWKWWMPWALNSLWKPRIRY